MAAYILASRGMFGEWTGASDFAALIISLAAGLWGIWLLPYSRLVRALLSPAYVALMGLLLVVGTLSLVCAAYNDCL
jgi:hypothetical protein